MDQCKKNGKLGTIVISVLISRSRITFSLYLLAFDCNEKQFLCYLWYMQNYGQVENIQL